MQLKKEPNASHIGYITLAFAWVLLGFCSRFARVGSHCVAFCSRWFTSGEMEIKCKTRVKQHIV